MCFVLLGCLSFHQPPGLCLSCLSSSLFPLPQTLLDSCATAWGGVGLLCMDTLSCIHGVGRWNWAMFLSNLTLVLFVSFIGPWQLERTPVKPHLQLQSYLLLLFTSLKFSSLMGWPKSRECWRILLLGGHVKRLPVRQESPLCWKILYLSCYSIKILYL